MERMGEYDRGSLCVLVCALQALASVDSGRAWHSACRAVFVHISRVCVLLCVHGWRTGLPPLPTPQSGICPLVY